MLLNAAPDQGTRDILLEALEDAYKGRSLAGIPEELVDAIANAGGGSLALKLRQQDPESIRLAIEALQNAQSGPDESRQIIQIFGELRRPEFVPVLLEVVQTSADEGFMIAALTALQSYSQPDIGTTIVKLLPQMQGDTREVAESLLASRLPWAKQLLLAVDNGSLETGNISEVALRKTLLHNDEQVRSLVTRHSGDVTGATTQ